MFLGRGRNSTIQALLLAAGLLAVPLIGVLGEDPPVTPVKLHGMTKLVPPADAANQEATGFVNLLQWGERMAIHVFVRHLEPGVTYDVAATRKVNDTEETATLGTITTRDGTPPPPRCYRTFLKPVVEEPPPPAEGMLHHHGTGDGAPKPGGFGFFLLNQDFTEMNYDLFVSGKVTAAAIVFGTADPVPLTFDERLRGTLAITADQLAALAAGDAALAVTTTVKGADGQEQSVDLTGELKPCFPDSFREWLAAHFAGTGALRLDSKRGDPMPFGVTTLKDLVGATISVKGADGKVVLSGTIGELRECTPPTPPAGGGAISSEDDQFFDIADENLFFDIPEAHDASFIRGDANDDGSFDLSDAISVLGNLFQNGPEPYCSDAADSNDSGTVDISDPIFMLQALFQQGGSLPHPSSVRGFDRTVDQLACGSR